MTTAYFDSIPASTYAEEQFAELNKAYYDRYVEHRVRGYTAYQSMSKVFGLKAMSQVTFEIAEKLEANPYYIRRFDERLKAIKVEELWNVKTSLHELLCIARSPLSKDSTRLNAVKELNVMVGIVVVDENGKTKAGRTLEDFYKQQGAASKDTLAHALPGTPTASPQSAATDEAGSTQPAQ